MFAVSITTVSEKIPSHERFQLFGGFDGKFSTKPENTHPFPTFREAQQCLDVFKSAVINLRIPLFLDGHQTGERMSADLLDMEFKVILHPDSWGSFELAAKMSVTT